MSIPIRLLIVEDTEDDCLLVVRELKKAGYEPTYARVETAVEMASALDNQEWDIVLCDYILPHFSGIDAIKLLKSRQVDLPCIILSGKITEDVAVDAMRSGAKDYVSKENLKRLIPAINRELSEKETRKQRKIAEERLFMKEEQYKTIIYTAMDGFWMADTKGRLLEVNDSYCKLSGYTKEELLGMSIPDLEAKETAEEIKEHVQKVIRAGRDRFETQHRCKDGKTVDLEASATYVDIEGGRFFCFLRDITERKKLEERLKEKITDLERFNKVAVDRELAMISLKQENTELKKRLGEKG